MRLEPYLFFNGRAEEALAFYQEALGAVVEQKMRFAESPVPHPEGYLPDGIENKIMHASFRIGDVRVMLSDGGAISGQTFDGFALSLAYPTETAARRAFDALSEGGRIDMPIGPTFWSSCFGMVRDRFGVPWMITIESS